MADISPFNKDIEEGVISGVFKEPESIGKIKDICKSGDFAWFAHKWIYETFISLFDSGHVIDRVTVLDDLRRRQRLESLRTCEGNIEGEAAVDYYISLSESVNDGSLESYAVKCHNDSANRMALRVADNIRQRVLSDGKEPIEVLTSAELELGKIAAYAGARTKVITPLSQALRVAVGETEQAAKGNVPYIQTGIQALDNLIGGVFPEQLITIAGRQGQGKSALALSIALNVAVFGIWKKKVGIFSLEMSNSEYVQRMISAISGISSLNLKMGKIDESNKDAYLKAVETLNKNENIMMDDTSNLTLPLLRNKMRKMKEWGVDLVILDQIGLMSSEGSTSDAEYARIDRRSYDFKNLAREFQIPFLNIQQMSRAVENIQRKDKEPKASDLSQAGESAPNIIIMISHEMERKRILSSRLWVVKNRDGATGYADVKFESHKTLFRDLTKEEISSSAPPLLNSDDDERI